MSSSGQGKSDKSTFKIFRAHDADELDDKHLSMEHISPKDIARVSPILEKGVTTKLLFADEASGFNLVYLWFKSGFTLPAHSHNVDCLYCIVGGTAILGKEVLEPGDGFFVPAHSFYTYQAGPEGVQVMEFRASNLFDIKFKNTEAFWQRLEALAETKSETWLAEPTPVIVRRIMEPEPA